ncbi:hypothetical protein CHUAL_005569 [Chamberlinius hualienensis]
MNDERGEFWAMSNTNRNPVYSLPAPGFFNQLKNSSGDQNAGVSDWGQSNVGARLADERQMDTGRFPHSHRDVTLETPKNYLNFRFGENSQNIGFSNSDVNRSRLEANSLSENISNTKTMDESVVRKVSYRDTGSVASQSFTSGGFESSRNVFATPMNQQTANRDISQGLRVESVNQPATDNQFILVEHLKQVLTSHNDVRNLLFNLCSNKQTPSDKGTVTSTYHDNSSQFEPLNRRQNESGDLLYERRHRLFEHDDESSDRLEMMSSRSQMQPNHLDTLPEEMQRMPDSIDNTLKRIRRSLERSSSPDSTFRFGSSKSPVLKRMRISPHVRSKSPVRRRSKSPIRRRSRSPLRRRSKTPLRRRSKSPVRRRSRSPIRRRSKSPLRRRTRSPVRKISRSPRRKSRSKSRERVSKGRISNARQAKKVKKEKQEEKSAKSLPASTSAKLDLSSNASVAHPVVFEIPHSQLPSTPFHYVHDTIPALGFLPPRPMTQVLPPGVPWPQPYSRPVNFGGWEGTNFFDRPPVVHRPPPPASSNLVNVPLVKKADAKKMIVADAKSTSTAPVKELPKLMQLAFKGTSTSSSSSRTTQTVNKSSNEDKSSSSQSIKESEREKKKSSPKKSVSSSSIKLNLLNQNNSKAQKSDDSKSAKSVESRSSHSEKSKPNENKSKVNTCSPKQRRKIRQNLRKLFIFDVCMYCGVRHVGKLDSLAIKLYKSHSTVKENVRHHKPSAKNDEDRKSVEVLSPEIIADSSKNIEVVNISDDDLVIGAEENDKKEVGVKKPKETSTNENTIKSEGEATVLSINTGSDVISKATESVSDDSDLEFQNVSDNEFVLLEELEEDLADGVVVEEITSDDETLGKAVGGDDVDSEFIPLVEEPESPTEEEVKVTEDEATVEEPGNSKDEESVVITEVISDEEKIDENNTEEQDTENRTNDDERKNNEFSGKENELSNEVKPIEECGSEAEEVNDADQIDSKVDSTTAEETEDAENENLLTANRNDEADEEFEMENLGSSDPDHCDNVVIDELGESDIEEESIDAAGEESVNEAVVLESEAENESSSDENIEDVYLSDDAIEALENLNETEVDLVEEVDDRNISPNENPSTIADTDDVMEVDTNENDQKANQIMEVTKENIAEKSGLDDKIVKNIFDCIDQIDGAKNGVAFNNEIKVEENESPVRATSSRCDEDDDASTVVLDDDNESIREDNLSVIESDEVVQIENSVGNESPTQAVKKSVIVDSEAKDDLKQSASSISQSENDSSLSTENKSELALDYILAGSLSSAFQLLHEQLGVVNFVPFKSISTTSICSAFTLTTMSEFPGQIFRYTMPTATASMDDIIGRLQLCYQAVTIKQPEESIEMFRSILHGVPLMIVEKNRGLIKANMLIKICRNYITSLVIELKMRSLDKSDPENEKRVCELAAYKTHCNLQPVHQILSLRVANNIMVKIGNFKTAAALAKRIIKAKPSAELVEKMKLQLDKYGKNMTNAVQLAYDSERQFVNCAETLTPIYTGELNVQCPFCHANYIPEFNGILCRICGISEVGRKGSGLQLAVEEAT